MDLASTVHPIVRMSLFGNKIVDGRSKRTVHVARLKKLCEECGNDSPNQYLTLRSLTSERHPVNLVPPLSVAHFKIMYLCLNRAIRRQAAGLRCVTETESRVTDTPQSQRVPSSSG